MKTARSLLLKRFFPAALVFLLLSAQALALTISRDKDVVYLYHPDKKVSPFAGAIDDRGGIHMAWAREDGDEYNIYAVVSFDKGETFSGPVAVNKAGEGPTGMHGPPSIATGPVGVVYVAWAAARPNGAEGADIRIARSIDNGRSFENPVVVNDAAVGSRGFESIVVSPDGSIHVAWLDGRDGKKGVSATYAARSIDGGRSFSKNTRVDGDSCPCCRTAIAVVSSGDVYVSWRKVFEGDVREIVAAHSIDGGRSFSPSVIVGRDNWKIEGCPHRGPGLVAGKDAVHAIWYTEAGDGAPCVYYGESSPSKWGSPFTKEVISCGARSFPDHPALALDREGRPVMLWEETTPVLGRIMMKSGSSNPVQLNKGMRRASHPHVSVNGKGKMLIVWSRDEMRFMKTAIMLKD